MSKDKREIIKEAFIETEETIHLIGTLLRCVASKSHTGFFTTYKEPRDVFQAFAAPLYAPLLWSALGVASAIASTITSVLSVGLLVASGVMAVSGKPSTASSYLQRSMTAAMLTGAFALLSPLLAIVGAVFTPVNLVQILTRTGASLHEKCTNMPEPNQLIHI